MNLSEKDLAERARAALGFDIAFAVAREPLARDSLSPAEKARVEGFGLPGRQEDWLKGRAALKRLLARLGMPADTSLLAFPHARLSMTHSAGVAVAVALLGPAPMASGPWGGAPAAGIGVDYEARKTLKAGAERFYISADERARLAAFEAEDRDLLRLWTVKEALFKADPLNRSAGGRYLSGYVIEGSLEARAGWARGPAPEARPFAWLTVETGEGILSAAVSGPA